MTVRLKGGLGNQLFQYAAGRALAMRNGLELALDMVGGFSRDKTFRRTYALSSFGLPANSAGWLCRMPFIYEQLRSRIGRPPAMAVEWRPWGIAVTETDLEYLPSLTACQMLRDVWMEGYWQNEAYFATFSTAIGRELTPPPVTEAVWLSMAAKIDACNAVAVGVRLFEELPGEDKSGVGGVAPLSFYSQAARIVPRGEGETVYFVFCASGDSVEGKLRLPGRTEYVTPDRGFSDPVSVLWLQSRCKHHVIANSSLFWWGAWLSEHAGRAASILACDLFPNKHTIPARWRNVAADLRT